MLNDGDSLILFEYALIVSLSNLQVAVRITPFHHIGCKMRHLDFGWSTKFVYIASFTMWSNGYDAQVAQLKIAYILHGENIAR